MASLAIAVVTSINGVAALHTRILQEQVFADYYDDCPQKFNNKTNGISHRRWLLYSNPQLRGLLDKTIGTEYHTRPQALERLMLFVEDKKIQEEFMAIKRQRKQILADYISREMKISINVDSLFDVQAKRLHAYKRQLLNILQVIYQYRRLKSDPDYRPVPRTYIFAAKAAPAYVFAKAVIKLINKVALVIAKDEEVNDILQVVFIPNYCVSIAEILLNAADVSQQISTAGKEASGTGNMKFMMNGAITLGTLDGANVEIDELVGRDNDVIFGLNEAEVRDLMANGYDVWEEYNSHQELQGIVDSLVDGSWAAPDEFKVIYDELMYGHDEYLVLKDFWAYVAAQEKIDKLYQDKSRWAKMALVNIAKSGFFSSDRTIAEYAKKIWDIQEVTME
jgi:starch phosphorylase